MWRIHAPEENNIILTVDEYDLPDYNQWGDSIIYTKGKFLRSVVNPVFYSHPMVQEEDFE